MRKKKKQLKHCSSEINAEFEALEEFKKRHKKNSV